MEKKFEGVEDEWDKFESFEEYDNFCFDWLKECRRVLKDNGDNLGYWKFSKYFQNWKNYPRFKHMDFDKMTTKVEAIKKLIQDFNGVASWEQIYNNIEKYYPAAKTSKEWKAGIRGVFYREIKNKKNFKKVGLGLYALEDYKEENILEEKK